MSRRGGAHGAVALLLSAVTFACGGELDAGFDRPHGLLPVDERSPIVLVNDGAMDNWQVEYAALFAATRRAEVIGLVVNVNAEYPSLETNVGNFRQLVGAARESGMRFFPDPTASIAPTLSRPRSGRIEDTVPNRSEGARLILRAASERGTRAHPLAIATGGALTDVADAYLMDPTLAERSVVVASLGQNEGLDARTVEPNGTRDPWATFIVTRRMPYVQVNGYYDQLLDLPESRVDELPDNAFGRWMAQKRPSLLEVVIACDQISVLAAARPWFATAVAKLRPDGDEDTLLVADAEGPIWHVPTCDTDAARDELWAMLKDPTTFSAAP
jgi:hypothetical protein